MKQIYVLIFLGALSLSIRAQITITSADLPVIGNMVINAVDTITPVSPGNPGTNQVWDLSNLVASRYDTIVYLPPEGVIGYEWAPGSNIVYDVSKAGTCEGCTTAYYYYFADQSDYGLLFTGVQTQMLFEGGFTLYMHWYYTGGRYQVPLPLNYGDNLVHSHISEVHQAIYYEGELADSTMTVFNDNYTITADASGTMITPYNTFQVIRIKDVNISHSYHYILESNEWVLDWDEIDTQTSYRWYTNDYFEVGHCDGDDKGAGFTFFKSETVVGTSLLPFAKDIIIYPNPATETVTVESLLIPDRLEVYDILGSLVSTGLNSKTIAVSDLSPGIYFLKVYTNSKFSLKKFVRQ
ncbi:MAG: T9SS type A sorting domain-containing protein [Lentimicrobium sp.]